MQNTEIDGINYYLPESITDVQQLVKLARQQKTQIRITGARHSVPASIYPDQQTPNKQQGIFVMLSKMNKVVIDKATKTVVVDAGCHLGYDPFDPTGTSTWKNSLFAQLDDNGFAVPDMGGIIHQTVGGFLSTGSSGGSTQFSFNECLQSLTFIPADSDDPQPVTVSINDPNTDLFYAAGVSMGLLGIIVSATFSLVEKFNIIGTETITSILNCAIDMTGNGVSGKTSLQDFLTKTQYSRLLWYPQPNVSRVTVWQANQLEPGAPFSRQPYEELQPILGSELLPQVAADLVYSAFGQWPNWLGKMLGTNTSAYKMITEYVDQNFYNTIFPEILPAFVTEDVDNKSHPGQPQKFEDFWYSSLPMDNNISDKLFPVEFTELWIPFDETGSTDKVAQVLQALNKLFSSLYQNPELPIAAGAFCTELYAAKKSNFWMSPAYDTNVFRVDVFWFGNNIGSPSDNYYPLYWNALQEFDFRCHWGKYLPAADSAQGAAYLQKQYPKWKEFLQFREKFDPLQIFVSDYWREHLNIAAT
ncbi:MAG: FAD-binding protein [Flavisolibacter sp.]